jgi:hypothetical protein
MLRAGERDLLAEPRLLELSALVEEAPGTEQRHEGDASTEEFPKAAPGRRLARRSS